MAEKRWGGLNDQEKMEALKTIVSEWGKKPTSEIAEELGIKKGIIYFLVSLMRKHGIELPKIQVSSWFTPEKVEELKKVFDSR
jgi:transposase